MNTRGIVNFFLWSAYLLALFASVSHVAGAFATIHADGEWLSGWAAAIAIDAGLAALAYSIQQRKKAKRTTWTLWVGVVVFAGISGYANTLYALQHTEDVFRAVVLSATLPILVVYLGEVVSSDDANAAQEAERLAEREARRLAREQEKLHTEERAGHNNAPTKSTPPEKETEVERIMRENKVSRSTAYRIIKRLRATVETVNLNGENSVA